MRPTLEPKNLGYTLPKNVSQNLIRFRSSYCTAWISAYEFVTLTNLLYSMDDAATRNVTLHISMLQAKRNTTQHDARW